MTRTEVIQRAIGIAVREHGMQLDKRGELYIYHPLRVMLNVPEDCRIAAVLHDTIEDTDCTLLYLECAGLEQVDLETIDLVTRPPAGAKNRPTYREFITRIHEADGESGRKARIIKKADIADNLGRALRDYQKKLA